MKSFFGPLLTQFRSLSKSARLLLIALFLDGLLFAGWQLFLNLYILEAGYSREFLGMITAAPSVSALLLGVPMGLLSDRMGRKRAMMMGFTLANFGIIGLILFPNASAKIAMAFFFGAVSQLYILSQAPFMMKVSDDKTRDVLFSFSFGMFPLASTLGNFLAGYLPQAFKLWLPLTSNASAYQMTILFSAVSSFLVLIPLAFIKEPKLPQGVSESVKPPERDSILKILFRSQTLKLALPNLVFGLGAAILVPYFNVFFAIQHKMSDSSLGILFSMGSLITGIACLIGPRLVGNLGGKIRTIVAGEGASLIFLLAIGFSPWLWLAILGYLVRGALMNMVAPLFDAYSLENSLESEHGAVNSIRGLAWNVGWAIGPYLSGVVQEKYGFSPLFVSTAILYGLGIALTWIFFRPGKNSRGPFPTNVPAGSNPA